MKHPYKLARLVVAGALASALGCAKAPVQKPQAEAAPPPPPADAQEFRATIPQGGPVPALHAPVAERRVLDNGLTVLVVPKHDLPLVSVHVVLKSGSAADPRARPGLAGFVAEMLKAGTKTRSASAIAEEVENHGATLNIGVDEDTTSLTFTALTSNYQPVLDVATDVLLHPAFAKSELERARKRRLAALEQQKDSPSSTASRVFAKVVFGNHPYGHTVLGDEKAVAAISRKDLQTYFAAHFRPSNAAVVVVGDVAVDEALAAIKDRLGGWTGSKGAEAAPVKPTPEPAALVLVDRPDAPQSQVRIGELGVARSTPDYYSLVIANAILGGMFNSRINMNLREDKGYTYGAHSVFDFRRGQGPFVVYTGVRTDVTAPAITEVLREIERMRESEVTDDELTHAKNSYSLSLPGYFQDVRGIAGMMANIFVFDLPLDYYQKLPDNIARVTKADVSRVAREYLHPEQLSIVVVGNRSKVEDGLKLLDRGEVQLRNADGT